MSKSEPYIETGPVQGAIMNEISTWVQDNWYSLGSLLAQFAFLAVGVWFAQKILRTIRASQEQMGALLKLSLTDGLKPGATPQTHRATPYVSADWPAAEAPAEAPALTLPEASSGCLARHRAVVTDTDAKSWIFSLAQSRPLAASPCRNLMETPFGWRPALAF